MLRPCSITLSLAFFFHFHGFTQSIQADTTFLAQASRNGIALYSQVIREQSHLYNGTEFHEYQSLKEEYPYLINDWIDGSVYYDGDLYQNAPLLYDISVDKVITEHYSSRQKIQLIDDKIVYFILKEHRFVHLQVEGIRKGFYELVYDGPTKVYVKRKKILQERITGGELIRTFDEKTLYYIFKQGDFHLVKNKKAVLHAFVDRKAELNQFIGKNKIRFKSNREKSIARLAKYYDSINN